MFLKTLFIVLNSSYINDLHDDVICNGAIYVDDTEIYSKCDQVSDFLQQLELASELNSDRLDTVDQETKWLVYFIAEKTQLGLFDRSDNSDATYVTMDRSVLE